MNPYINSVYSTSLSLRCADTMLNFPLISSSIHHHLRFSETADNTEANEKHLRAGQIMTGGSDGG